MPRLRSSKDQRYGCSSANADVSQYLECNENPKYHDGATDRKFDKGIRQQKIPVFDSILVHYIWPRNLSTFFFCFPPVSEILKLIQAGGGYLERGVGWAMVNVKRSYLCLFFRDECFRSQNVALFTLTLHKAWEAAI